MKLKRGLFGKGTPAYYIAILAGFFGSVLANIVNKVNDYTLYITLVVIIGFVIFGVAIISKMMELKR